MWPFRRKRRPPIVGEYVLVHREVLEVAREIADAGALIALDRDWSGRCRLVGAMRRALSRPVPKGPRGLTAEEISMRIAAVTGYEFIRPSHGEKP